MVSRIKEDVRKGFGGGDSHGGDRIDDGDEGR